MDYQINDVAEFLHVSKDLIRYYEKKGALQPARDPENNYRVYTIENIFRLMEIMAFKDVGVNVRDASEMMNNPQGAVDFLENRLEQVQLQIRMESLLATRLQELIDRIKRASKSLYKGSTRTLPKRYVYPFVSSHNGIFDEITMPNEISEILFDSKRLPFFDAVISFEENTVTGYLSLEEPYLPILYPYSSEFLIPIEGGDYYCMMVDMTQSHSLDSTLLRIQQLSQQEGIALGTTISGTLSSRTTNWKEEGFRWNELELEIPIMR